MIDDLVLEIFSRLPLKYAFHCSSLNKTFKNYISGPNFARKHALLSSSNPIVFECEDSKIIRSLDPLFGLDPISTTLSFDLKIMASCNGVLLIRIDCFNKEYHVFNPTTGEKLFVDYHVESHDDFGLAVNVDAVSTPQQNSQFKLVMIDAEPSYEPCRYDQSVLKFTVVVPSVTTGAPPSMVVKSKVDFTHKRITLMADHNIRPVYAHGCLLWLIDDATKIVAFDVEKEKPKIINGPGSMIKNRIFDTDHAGKWFGFSQGSIQFIYTMPEEIVIHTHDHLKDEWRIAHRIANIFNPTLINTYLMNGVPLFFDGVRLFLHVNFEIHMHDSGKWKKKREVNYGSHIFFEFFPTLAKVSNDYLDDTSKWEYHSFFELQRLLRYSKS